MGLISRFTALIQAKINQLLSKAEDPRQTLDYSYQRQLELLQNVKRGIVEVVTSKRRLELQGGKLQEQVRRLDDQAKQAVLAGRDDLATLALQRKQFVQGELGSLQNQISDLQQEQQKLQTAETRLSMKVEAFRTRKETIKAQYSAAEAQVRIGEAVTGLSEEMADIGLSIQRAEDKTEHLRARAGAIDQLVEAGTLTDYTGARQDVVERELARISTDESVNRELEALKRQLGTAQQPKLIEGSKE